MPTIPAVYRPLIVLASGMLVVSALYFAQDLFIPIALSILLAFLLNPIVDAFERRGVGSTTSAALVVCCSLGVLAGLIVVVSYQVRSLVEELPQYRENISEKIGALRAAQEGPFSELAQKTLADIRGELEKTVESEPAADTVPVRIEEETPPLLVRLPSMLQYLASAGLVIVLVLFLLLGRKTLRDRLIFLFGRRHLTMTTKALDEASGRISRYLLVQATMNAGFGICVSIVLFALGVDYALLWGFFAAVFRFIPYVGPWLAAGLPILLCSN
jgi:predicted PurR-regulated permease PerM